MQPSVTYQVEGMHCASCARVIEKKLSKLPEVKRVSVNLALDTASISSDQPISLTNLNAAISNLGYKLVPLVITNPVKQNSYLISFLIAIVAFSLMLLEIGFGRHFSYVPFILASINLLIFGRQFIKAIPRFLRTGYANMDTLVGIGTTTAYLYSIPILFFNTQAKSLGLPEMVYFDVTAVVIGFILFGKHLESISKIKTGQAISKLLKLQAKTAIVIRNNQQIEVPAEQVNQNETILIKPGSKVPFDGIIVDGNTAIDESAMTGEPLPFEKKPGDRVIGGTVNTYAAITVKVTKTGEETILAKIIAMVKQAQSSKAPVERLADRVSAVFVPIVLVVALLTLLGWIIFGNSIATAISSFVSVLVIACPCAMGLATPTGIIVGVGRGAENGILVKDAESLEKLHHINTVVLDKTGTLTIGQPKVIDIVATKKHSKTTLINIAASLESLSDHPLAKAIVDYAKAQNITPKKVSQFINLPGKGVEGDIAGVSYRIGNNHFVPGGKISPQPGSTTVWIGSNGKVIGSIVISDQVRQSAAWAINQLKHMSIEVIMVTGDQPQTAEFIGKQVGISKIFAGVMPDGKAAIIKELHSQGSLVAMVGDGINDAPALAAADVGIAMSTGSDIAIESANITLLHGDITKIEKSISLSKRTMKIIRQNLFWAFVYNTIGIPLAAAGLLSPVLAGAAMALSSVSVVGNSLRLKRIKL